MNTNKKKTVSINYTDSPSFMDLFIDLPTESLWNPDWRHNLNCFRISFPKRKEREIPVRNHIKISWSMTGVRGSP